MFFQKQRQINQLQQQLKEKDDCIRSQNLAIDALNKKLDEYITRELNRKRGKRKCKDAKTANTTNTKT